MKMKAFYLWLVGEIKLEAYVAELYYCIWMPCAGVKHTLLKFNRFFSVADGELLTFLNILDSANYNAQSQKNQNIQKKTFRQWFDKLVADVVYTAVSFQSIVINKKVFVILESRLPGVSLFTAIIWWNWKITIWGLILSPWLGGKSWLWHRVVIPARARLHRLARRCDLSSSNCYLVRQKTEKMLAIKHTYL